MMDTATIFKNILLDSRVRETQMSTGGEEYKMMVFMDKKRPEVDADFYIAYDNEIFRLEIVDFVKYGIETRRYEEIKEIIVEGYNALQASGEYDNIMTMLLHL